jgi:cytochrome c oxidase assembly factor 5
MIRDMENSAAPSTSVNTCRRRTSRHATLTHVSAIEAGRRVQTEGKSAKECAKTVKECQKLRETFYNCKRGQIDNTKRIRGNKGY